MQPVRHLLQLLLFLVEQSEHIRSNQELLELLGVFELKVSLHERDLDQLLTLHYRVLHVLVLNFFVVNFTVFVKRHVVFAKVLKHGFGLNFELFGTFGDFLNDLDVGEMFQAIMNVTSLLVLSQQSLCSFHEAFLLLSKGLFDCQSLRVLDNLVEDGLVFERVFSVCVHRQDIFDTFSGARVFIVHVGFHPLLTVPFKLGKVSHETLHFQFTFKLSNSLCSVEVGVTMSCECTSSEDAHIVALLIEHCFQLRFNKFKRLEISVPLLLQLLVLLEEVNGGVVELRGGVAPREATMRDHRHQLESGESSVKLVQCFLVPRRVLFLIFAITAS